MIYFDLAGTNINGPLFTELPATTVQSNCPTTFANTPIQADYSIRLLDAARTGNCAFKKYNSYKPGDEIWYKPCDVSNSNIFKANKYKFTFNETTGQIFSKGAKDQLDLDLCWQVPSVTRTGKQRIKLQNCDASEPAQQFVVISGRLHIAVNTRLCAGVEEFKFADNGEVKGVAITAQICYPTTWGETAGCGDTGLVSSVDQSIRPFGMSADNICLFKRYSGYNVNDEIWLRQCDASHTNAKKAGKYWWSYEEDTGLIVSEGSRDNDPENLHKQ